MSLWERVVMAIEIAVDFRRLTRAGVWSLAGILTFSAAAGAQATCGTATTPPCVSVGSLIPIPYNSNMNQIYKVLFYKGNVLAIDTGADVLYQLPPGATSWNNISGPSRNTTFLGGSGGGGYNSQSMAIDAVGNLYITDTSAPTDASNALFWRFVYNPTSNTWGTPSSPNSLSTAGAWGGNIVDPANGSDIVAESGQGTVDVQFENSPAMDGSGTLYFATQQNQIYSVQVDASGNLVNTTATTIVNATEGGGVHMAIDEVGNIYFVEGHALTNATRATGIWFIPAGSPPITGTGGTAESKMIRVDNDNESSTPVVYAGVTLDAAGNLYMTSESNSTYNETFAGIWEIPNLCGPSGVTAANVNTCMDDGEIQLLAPISSNQPLAIDSRGNFWVPTYQGYSPSGESQQLGVFSIAVFAPGILDLSAYTPGSGIAGPTPVGTTSLPGNLYMSFNGSFTPTAFQFTNATGGASLQFGTTQNNPLPPSGQTTPTVPCNGKSGTPPVFNTYTLTNSCLLWVTLTPTAPGPVSGLLTIYGTTPTGSGTATTNVNYSVYVNGTGLGGAAAFLNSPQLNTLAAPTALTSPGQVASDSIGDIWVADGGAKQVFSFPAGSSSAAGQSIASIFSDPTGVAVDGVGDVYVADYNPSKKKSTVYELPWVPNPPPKTGGASGSPIKLATGFGNNLNLAVDGSGNLYVADPDNARVVKIPTPAEADLVVNPEVFGDASTTTTVTVGSGFAAPSAVAVDPSGDVFVADGTSLYEISVFPYSAQTTITNSLPGNVTGLAVDTSGSVIAAILNQGLYRIPNFVANGVAALSVNSASLIDTSFTLISPSSSSSPSFCGGPGACSITTNVTKPGGVALDQAGNIYVADTTNGANLYQMNVTQGLVNYGVGLTPATPYEQDLDLFNIGNEPLNLTSIPQFSGPDTANDYTLTTPSAGTKCDTSGATAVATASSCSLGPTFEGPVLPPQDLTPNIYQGDSLSIPTNATNIGGAGTATANLFAATINNLETTQTTPVFNPTSLTYPGSGTVTVSVAPSPTSTYNYAPAAVGQSVGSVALIVSCTLPGCTQPSIVQTGTAYVTSSGPGDNFSASATFNNLPTLDGGTYSVTAEYEGSVINLTGKSTGNTNFTIARAMPVITLSEPLGVTPDAFNGVYYVLQGGTGTLVANVSSKVGIPSNNVPVTFTNGSQPLLCTENLPSGQQGEVPCTANFGTLTGTTQEFWLFDTGVLPTGSYSLIASWAGDINYLPVQTTVPSKFQLTSPAVLLTASPATLTTTAGTPVATTITIEALVGFTAPSGANIICNVSKLGAPNFPPDSECTFSAAHPFICPPTSTNGPCTPTTTVLTLNTNVPVNVLSTASNTQRPQHFRSPLALAGIFGLGLLGLALRRRAIFNRYLLNLVCLGLFFAGTVMGITSCTNDSYSSKISVPTYKTPPGTYNISIQVTDLQTGALKSLPFTLTVTVQ